MRLVFVVPCHGRHEIATACLTQLRRACDDLAEGGLDAAVVLVSDDGHFRELARTLRFDHVTQANQPLGRKWNDAYEWACLGLKADFVVPFGSDDVIDPAFVLAGGMPDAGTVRCARTSAIVHPDGDRMATLAITYPGGDGVRIYPREVLEPVGFRPCRDDRARAIDSNTLRGRAEFTYFDLHPLQIVDFKGAGNLNGYEACTRDFGVTESRSPFADLQGLYPGVFLDEVQSVYGLTRVAA